jgi:hypothetical protein
VGGANKEDFIRLAINAKGLLKREYLGRILLQIVIIASKIRFYITLLRRIDTANARYFSILKALAGNSITRQLWWINRQIELQMGILAPISVIDSANINKLGPLLATEWIAVERGIACESQAISSQIFRLKGTFVVRSILRKYRHLYSKPATPSTNQNQAFVVTERVSV